MDALRGQGSQQGGGKAINTLKAKRYSLLWPHLPPLHPPPPQAGEACSDFCLQSTQCDQEASSPGQLPAIKNKPQVPMARALWVRGASQFVGCFSFPGDLSLNSPTSRQHPAGSCRLPDHSTQPLPLRSYTLTQKTRAWEEVGV